MYAGVLNLKHVLFLLISFGLTGCSTVGYYMEAINGHFEIVDKSRPIETVISENKSVELTKKLENFQQARQFAADDLLLPDNNSYKKYADIGRPYAVWNVIAAPKYSVEPKKWCFLFVGCISYRGYFNKYDAEAYAKQLESKGYDVYVAGARAYSTLGWFDDPLLNTMMYKSEAARVGILFHELAHQKIYIEDDSAFNEAFATAIEQEGVKRWFIKNNKIKELAEYEVFVERRNEFNFLLKSHREKLKELYMENIHEKEKLTGKRQIFEQLIKEYGQLKLKWQGYNGYDQWMEQGLNNAHLAIIATYNDLVPFFRERINKSGNITEFYNYISSLSEKDLTDRKQLLSY